jgi:hypothetical protein
MMSYQYQVCGVESTSNVHSQVPSTSEEETKGGQETLPFPNVSSVNSWMLLPSQQWLPQIDWRKKAIKFPTILRNDWQGILFNVGSATCRMSSFIVRPFW